jgi:hypothetical protein
MRGEDGSQEAYGGISHPWGTTALARLPNQTRPCAAAAHQALVEQLRRRREGLGAAALADECEQLAGLVLGRALRSEGAQRGVGAPRPAELLRPR